MSQKTKPKVIRGWVQVTEDDTIFYPENIMGTKLAVEFAPKKSLLTWEAKRNGTHIRRATLTIEGGQEGRRCQSVIRKPSPR